MKPIIRTFFSFYIITSLTLGSVGIELFRHVCLSHSFNSVSIVDKPTCDHHNYQTSLVNDCCSEVTNQTLCCEDYDNFHTDSVLIITNTEQCCESSSELKKIEEILTNPFEKKVLIRFVNFVNVQISDLSETKSELEFNNQNNFLPPAGYGRNFLNSIHQLKIDTPVC